MLSLFRRSFIQNTTTVWRASIINSDTLLGDLHYPDTVTIVDISGGSLQLSWSTENGPNGQASDEIIVTAIDTRVDTGDSDTFGRAKGTAFRSDGSITINRTSPGGQGTWEEGVYFSLVAYNSNNAEDEQRSFAKWYKQLV
jgi:hypothetical protein